ncbi:TRAP transporter substrate-binding protein [Paenibacillus aestuarii]|uniref:TRAP transporter substrate-binding protein n=1 Tax=Paenibacillus aestuarii TaxID=516965 RepID=A0ABW0K2F3_9BACL|nr:TRAP transporter substrate-binding protein [Paenibacillus aestuarii]
MKKKLVTGSVVALLLTGSILTGCSSQPAAGGNSQGSTGAAKPEDKKPTLTMRLADTHPPDYPTVLGDKKFAELVNQKSNGRIKIDVFPSSQLGEEKAVVEQVQLGAIEFTRVSTGVVADFSKAMGVFSLPYIFDNEEHEWKFLNSAEGNKLLDSLSASRFAGLAYYDSGARHFYSRKPITQISDLKGQKIRVIQNKINIDLISALGASATPMPYGDVFSSLQTGVIDAAENNWPSYDTSNHYTVAKNMILDGHQRVPEVLMMSKVAFDKLSDEDKKIVKQAAQESVQYQRDEWKKFEKKSEEKIRAAGVTITEVKDVKPWQDAVKPTIDKYRAEYKDVLDAIDKARK